MNIHFGNQSQFELFPKTTGDTIENVAPRFIFSRLVLSFENLVVVFVFIIVSLVIAFSVGVERGRRNTAMARPVAQAIAPASIGPGPLARPQIPAMSAPAVVNGAALPMGRSVYPSGKFVAAMPASAEAARALPQLAPVLPVLAKTAVSEKVVDKGYTVQVASYKKESYAQKEAADLRKQGMDSLVLTKGSFVIVCVGRFGGQEEAKKMADKLKKRYKDCVIRSL